MFLSAHCLVSGLNKYAKDCGLGSAPEASPSPRQLEVQMKTMLRWTSALCMLSLSTMASGQSLPPGFTVGYNEAWVEDYGFWLAYNQLFPIPSAFNGGSLTSAMFSGMKAGNAKIVRIFLFPALQGICINQSKPECPAAPGLTTELLGNLTTVFLLARQYNLKLYITALNANDANLATQSNCPTYSGSASFCKALLTYYQNLFSNTNNYNSIATQTYETSVLGPILGLMSQYQDVVYGFDLIDEIEAALNAGYFSNYWTGAQAWIRNMTAFVKSKSPWLPVTSTAGYGYAVQEVTFGLFSGLGLNFYDVHIYSDSGTYSGQTALCSKTKSDKLQIVLGEYGQKSNTVSDTIQNTATTQFLYRAKSSCFSSALAWKYEALYTSSPQLTYLYITDGVLSTNCTPQLPGPACPRPAYTIIKNFVP
jgi:hypothetical protein